MLVSRGENIIVGGDIAHHRFSDMSSISWPGKFHQTYTIFAPKFPGLSFPLYKNIQQAVPQKNELGSCTRNQPNNSELSLLKVRTCAPKIAIFRGKPHGIQLVSKHFQPHRWENWRLSTTSSWRLVGLQNVPSRPCSIVTPNKITMFNKKFSELNGSWFPWWS